MALEASKATAQLLSDADRRALSDRRITIGFLLFTLGLLLAISGLIVVLVTEIFDQLTPTVRHDLEWKARRGLLSLGREIDLALVTDDVRLIEHGTRDFRADGDVRAIVAMDVRGRVVYQYGAEGRRPEQLFVGPPRTLRERARELVVWNEIEIEGIQVGRVALVVSTERVAAGNRLRRRILGVAGIGCLGALFAGLLFVSLYIAPILRITHSTIERLEQTTVQALEATRLKSEFLANMSHEIRTPMNGVLAMSDLLMRTALDGRQLRLAEIIRASARGLLTIVNDVLDFSKIEAGKYELSPSEFDVRLTIRDAVELLAPRAQAKGIELGYSVADEVPALVHADVDRFRQVLMNLLGNAIKFTERGSVSLSVHTSHSADGVTRLECKIRDSGPGISAEGQAKLFRSFSQVDGSSTRKYGGTGLGLAISQRLVALMGGEIGVESRVGEGSTFWFSSAVRVIEQNDPGRASSLSGRRVLVASDSVLVRSMLESHLTRWGMTHESSTSVGDALVRLEQALMSERPFDVVLVDAKLDRSSGGELARAIVTADVRTAVALLTEGAAVDSAQARLSVEVPRLMKPVRESELRELLLQMCHLDAAPGIGSRRGGLTPVPRKGGQILAVDDNEINQTVAVELLTELGFGVDVANQGREAVEAVKRRSYAAVLMDCQMPIMDGYRATEEIRQWERELGRPRMPIIALTAHAISGEREKVIAAGMDDYLTKPIVRELLEAALVRFLAHTAEADEQTLMRAGATCLPDNDASPLPSAAPPSAAASPAVADALLDPAVARSSKVIELFLRLVPAQIESIAEAARDRSASDVRARAHKLKGSCASLGAKQMAQLCERLQDDAEGGEIAQAVSRCAQLRVLFEQTAALLREERGHRQGSASSARAATS